MNIINEKGYTPNVLHFHGQNMEQLTGTFHSILENHEVDNNYDKSRLKIVSTWTDEENCCLYQQCKKSGIDLVNCVPEDYDRTQPWYMPNKIKFFIDVLENTTEELVMFLDGYDVLLTHLDDIIERFENQQYHILFGPSCNNYPDVKIDRIPQRANKGVYRYFNAGCVIGYTQDLLKFYKEALQYIDVKNPLNSEQFILRIAFSKYSTDKTQNFVWVDFKSKIFQSMGRLDTKFSKEEVYFKTNIVLPKNILVIKDNFSIYDSGYYTSKDKTISTLIETDKVNNLELLEYIMENNMINYILIEAQDRKDIRNIFENLSNIAKKYETKCFFVFSKYIQKRKREQLMNEFQNKYTYFIKDSTIESVYEIT